MKPTTGRSKRTPAKHDLMTKLFGREIGAAHMLPFVSELLWLDLTAGDGLPSEPDREWHRSCSPGILAYLARFPDRYGVPQAVKPTRVVLHERQARTFHDLLIPSLAERLPELGYKRVDDAQWECGPVTLQALNADGALADLSAIRPSTAVMVSNDPNAIVDWAMPGGMPEDIRGRTLCFLGISTMGCNPAGLKRLPPEQRAGWYDHVNSMISKIRAGHDLFIAAIERDDSQWAYLITAPTKWREATERDAVKAFDRHGMNLRHAWWRTNNTEFRDIVDILFLTRGERSA
jgi:hypothetical protein